MTIIPQEDWTQLKQDWQELIAKIPESKNNAFVQMISNQLVRFSEVIESKESIEELIAKFDTLISEGAGPEHWVATLSILNLLPSSEVKDSNWLRLLESLRIHAINKSVEQHLAKTPPQTEAEKRQFHELQILQTDVRKLPNQIVGPALTEIYRNLEPISNATTQTQISLNALTTKLDGLISAMPTIMQDKAATATQIEVTPHLQSIQARLDVLEISQTKHAFQHETEFCILETAAIAKHSNENTIKKPAAVLNTYKEDKIFDNLKKFNPKLFPTWKKLFDAAKKSYIEAPNQNCSTWTSPVARAFRAYVKLFQTGRVLDIGCGPYADPVYLQGLPSETLTAIEPLDLLVEPKFRVIKALNEFIPFGKNSFETVINATSLDHVIDVERALIETTRVMSPDAHFIIWYANVKTAPNPMTEYDGPLDDYHLFHTNDEWFLPLLDRFFHTNDRRVFAANPTHDNVFACLTLKKEN